MYRITAGVFLFWSLHTGNNENRVITCCCFLLLECGVSQGGMIFDLQAVVLSIQHDTVRPSVFGYAGQQESPQLLYVFMHFMQVW